MGCSIARSRKFVKVKRANFLTDEDSLVLKPLLEVLSFRAIQNINTCLVISFGVQDNRGKI